ncbi:MAG TPA: Holliday junction branch migration protein RuvA [Firmicutes bacterium]|nr:Holliday junction branch migration protein RuvA [Bacillota bacterium]
MFYSIRGKLLLCTLADTNFTVVLEAGGIGFEIKTSQNTAAKLPQPGSEARLFTYLHVREDAMELFGFFDQEELNCFKMLLSVSGVGPKAALSILSAVSAGQFALCVASGDSKALTQAKGIGLKIAQRIVLELKDKISKEQMDGGAVGNISAAVQGGASGAVGEAISALAVLGYSQAEAAQAISKLDPSLTVEELIRQALKALAGRM